MARASIIERTHLHDPTITIRYCGYCRNPLHQHPGGTNRSCRVEPGGSDRGELEEHDIPMKVSRPKRLTGQTVRYLARNEEIIAPRRQQPTVPDAYDRATQRLWERYPQYAEVFFRSRRDLEPLAEIAADLGIGYENAKKRGQRGEARFKVYFTAEGGDVADLQN